MGKAQWVVSTIMQIFDIYRFQGIQENRNVKIPDTPDTPLAGPNTDR